jgi:glycosyltransferase involved in cell wall biosynthesis
MAIDDHPVQVRIEGPFETSFSLSLINRHLALALAALPGVQVTVLAVAAPGNGISSNGDLSGDPALASLADPHGTTPTPFVIRSRYPPDLSERRDGALTAVWFMWEDSLIPGGWADRFNRNVDLAIVPSQHVRAVLRASGVAIPIAVVPLGVDPLYGQDAPVPDDLPTRKRFRFLHVSSGLPRKGCDVLLRAYAAEFSASDDAALVVKTLPQFDHDVAARIRRLQLLTFRCPEILHIDRDIHAAGMHALYRDTHALVHPARAEGFGLPVAEAMLAGVPVIVTQYGGPLDFCTPETATFVGGRKVPSDSPFRVPDAEWFEPDETALRAAMRAAYDAPDDPGRRARAARARQFVASELTWENAARRTVAALQAAAGSEPMVRTGLVTTWNTRCGVAEYSRHLVESAPLERVSWTILAPADRRPIRQDETNVVRCWNQDDPESLLGIAAEAARRGLEVVHLHLHLNMFGRAHVKLLDRLQADRRRVFITLHSTRSAQPDAALRAALGKVDRLLVHAEADRLLLADFGLRGNVAVLPQGCIRIPFTGGNGAGPPAPRPTGPVIATFGFLREHKGIVELIGALARVRRRHPQAELLALTSHYDEPASLAYDERCRQAARELGLEQAIRLVTDFLEPHQILDALHGADVVALPYHRTIDSSSAAVRMALASGRPVVVTRQPVFADVSGEVHGVDRPTPRALAEGILEVLEDPELARSLVERAASRVSRDDWASIAAVYARMVQAAVSGAP